MIESLIKLNAVEVRTWIFLIFALLIIMNIISTGVLVLLLKLKRRSCFRDNMSGEYGNMIFEGYFDE
jgi:type IV secretory pathway component VirB8